MATTVKCDSCGATLNEDPNPREDERKPCPVCGSTARQFHVALQPLSGARSGFAAGNFGIKSIRATSELLLQAVIVPGDKTSEGRLVEAVTAIWFDIIDLLQLDPSVAFQIPWEKWEQIIAGAYHKAGFDEVILTRRSGDYGRDVIATKRVLGSVRVIEQVKAYKPDYRVEANDVRAMIGVLQTDGAAKGFVTTTSDFAPRIWKDPTIVPFIPSRLELINGTALLARLQELRKSK